MNFLIMIASYNRGMKALTLSGGVRTHLVENQLQVCVTFQLMSQAEAPEFAHWAGARQTELKNHAEATTRHGRFLRVESYLVGSRGYLNFYYHTADALGVNMATVATGVVAEWIMEHAQPQPLHYYLPGGMRDEESYKSVKLGMPYEKGVENFRGAIKDRDDFDPAVIWVWGTMQASAMLFC